MAERPTAPPRSLLLVHGSGSGPWIFEGWIAAFPGVTVDAVDLHAGLDVRRASHADYAEAVARAAAELPRPLALCGWSMGGLVVLQAAEQVRPDSVVVIEPSAPAEVQGSHPETEVADGSFDPEALYGRPFPAGMRARPESSRARAERKRGISVPSLPCPSLVVFGDEFRDERGTPVAELYGSDALDLPGLDHWDVVLDERVPHAVARWLGVGTSEAGRVRAP
jgi:pimeloyl-ACP methyl ester carboxylesterase